MARSNEWLGLSFLSLCDSPRISTEARQNKDGFNLISMVWVFDHECREVIPEIVISAVRYASMSLHTGPHPCLLAKDLILICHAQAPIRGTILARRRSIYSEHVINLLHDPLS